MIRVTIIGASGYAGAELIRILANHKECEIAHLVAKSQGGKSLGEVFPSLGYLTGLQDMILEDVNDEEQKFLNDVDVVFMALPHGASAPFVRRCIEKNIKAIDLGADFRFRDVDTYEAWYGKHTYPEICKDTVYGLVEVKREQIKGQQFIANPGCYVTGATLAMYPLVKEGLVDLNSLIFDSKSGISGAGRGAKEAFLYGECSESIKAYGVASHRHTPEIEQNLGEAAGEAVTINFTPHLTPMNRGILTTAYATLNEKGKEADLAAVFEKYYGDEFFIKLLPAGKMPETKWIQGTNFVVLGFTTDPRTGR
ncbi:MAG: N-acetyl-gamma-glutamyl-phosphate reductase, partial [Firmicutes bacterium]|nr:N-acetyl-gamma-glutamyl-phosphate reductase [Bacillota bacterium]